jgi:cytosine/adenosine deaminase-related metal-dependent hydrolase
MKRNFYFSSHLFDGKNLTNENQQVLVFENEIFRGKASLQDVMPQEIYRTQNVLTPGFVNAHHHTELSALKPLRYSFNGINDFFKEVIQKRYQVDKEVLSDAAVKEIEFMENNGIVLCGDISNHNTTAEVKAKSKLSFHTFVEIIGYDINTLETSFKKYIQISSSFENKKDTVSLSLHAPFTVHPLILKNVMSLGGNKVTCMHYMESQAETEWYNGDKTKIQNIFEQAGSHCPDEKEFVDFYKPDVFLKMPFSKKFLIVHGTYLTNDQPIHHDVFRFCLCPRSNLIIEHKLPNAEFVRRISNDFCLGTDSLASTPDGNVLNEANLMLKEYSFLTTEQVLKAITYNGALALGRENEFGSFREGKKCGLNEINIENRKINFEKKLV